MQARAPPGLWDPPKVPQFQPCSYHAAGRDGGEDGRDLARLQPHALLTWRWRQILRSGLASVPSGSGRLGGPLPAPAPRRS